MPIAPTTSRPVSLPSTSAPAPQRADATSKAASSGWGPKPPARTLSEALRSAYPALAADVLKRQPADLTKLSFSSGMTNGRLDMFQVAMGSDGRPRVTQWNYQTNCHAPSSDSARIEQRLLAAMNLR